MRRFFFIFLMLGFAAACGELDRQYGDEGLRNNEGFDPSISAACTPFPHADDWEGAHGSCVVEGGYDDCLACHTVQRRGNPASLPGCFDCHDSYPHRAITPSITTWDGYTGGHGETAERVGIETCKLCHGPDLTEEKNGKTCFTCHLTYPHEVRATQIDNKPSWQSEHFVYALDNAEQCQACHGLDYEGGERNNPSCVACHSELDPSIPFPHIDGWLRRRGELQLHGEYVMQNTNASCVGSSCHGNGTEPVPTASNRGPACGASGCHGPTYPHVNPWNHGLSAWVNIDSCKGCHGEGLNVAPPGFNSCVECHASVVEHDFAEVRSDDWEPRHDEYAARDLTECTLCHGNDFTGGVSGQSCFECHDHLDDFPENWMGEGRGTEHAMNFIRQLEAGDGLSSTCQACHGASYDEPTGADGLRCTDCHEGGVTHTRVGGVAWSEMERHGLYFSSNFTAGDDEARCWDCHGAPVPFNSTQTRDEDLTDDVVDPTDLTVSSQCYGCHFTYPHVGWIDSFGNENQWEVVVEGSCGPSTEAGIAHIYYVQSSPLVTDADGNRPGVAGTTWADGLGNTCGGSGGGCHQDGNRSFRLGWSDAQCTGYCHNSSRPWPPEPRDCEVPPDSLVDEASAPSVASIAPFDGETDVAVIGASSSFRTIIVVDFSEAMDRSTVTASGAFFVLNLNDGSVVDGRVTCSSSPRPGWCQRATFTPMAQLDFDTPYQVNITQDVRDWGGTPLASYFTSEFQTAARDVTAPSVLSTDPEDGETEVLFITREFTVTFDEPLSRSSVTEHDQSSHLSCTVGGDDTRFCVRRTVLRSCPRSRPGCNYVSGHISCASSDCRTVRLTMNSGAPDLDLSTNYTLTVEGYRDLSGNMMVGRYVGSFTTGVDPCEFERDYDECLESLEP